MGMEKIRLGWIAIASMVALTVAELFTVFFYRSLFSVHVVQLVMETNTQESSEFLSAAMSSSATWQTAVIAVIVAGASAGITYCSDKLYSNRWLRYTLLALILWSGIRQTSAYGKLSRCFGSESIAECADARNIPHLNTPYVRLAYGVAFNSVATKELETLAATVEKTSVESCSAESPLIVLVIGESFSKHHSPLFTPGYNDTNPCLQKWQKRGNLIVYNDAVSPFNITSHAFKYMFSTWDEECHDDWTHHTLFPAVFRKAGYDVHLVTNQFVTESKDDWNAMGGTIFNHPRLSELQFSTHNDKAYRYDGEMLSALPSHDLLTSKPTLLIVHLYGQHVNYADRYPAEYAKFKAADSATEHGGDTGKEICAQYDNATLYNDAVVDSVFRLFGNDDAIGIYLSDHGEEVFDWRDKYERTNEDVLMKEIIRYQYEIPLLFFMTDRYQELHPELARQVRNAAGRRFISTDISNVLFHLAGIRTREYKEKHDILSDRYDKKRKRIIRNETDYDKTMAE